MVSARYPSICENCNASRMVTEDKYYLACTTCGECVENPDRYVLSFNDEVSISSSPKRKKELYTRLAYFEGLIEHLICHKTIPIPELNLIKQCMKMLNGKGIETLKRSLKILRLQKYYKHMHYILSLLQNDGRSETLSLAECRLLKELFMSLQEPYERHKHLFHRENFLNYQFVLKKLLILIGRDDIAKLVITPKKRIEEHEEIWKRMMF